MKLSEQIGALLWQRQQQQQRAGGGAANGDDHRSSTGSEASFKTASEGATPSPPPKIRLVSPSGGSYAPSFPSTVGSFASAVPDLPSSRPPTAPHPPPTQPTAVPNAPHSTPPAGNSTTAISSGLMERLKAQRAARLAEQATAPAPASAEGVAGSWTQPFPPSGPAAVPPPSHPPSHPSPPKQQNFPSSPRPSQLSSPSLKDELPRASLSQNVSGWAAGQAVDGGWRPAGWEEGEEGSERMGKRHTGNVPSPSSRHPQQQVFPDDFAHFPSRNHPRDVEPHFLDGSGELYPDEAFDFFPHGVDSAGRTPIPASFPHLDNFSPQFSHLAFPSRGSPSCPHPERPDSRTSERTILHEARPAASSSAPPPFSAAAASPAAHSRSSTVVKAVSDTSSPRQDPWAIRAEREMKEREKKLEWERAERGRKGLVDHLVDLERSNPSRASSKRSSVGGTTLVDEQLVEGRGTRRSGRSSAASGLSERGGGVLAEGRLLLPLSRSFFPHDFHNPSIWSSFHTVLSPDQLRIFPVDQPPYRLFRTSEIERVGRLDERDREGFEPFFVELKNGEKVVMAGSKKLDAAYWVLALENARARLRQRHATFSSSITFRSSSSPSFPPLASTSSQTAATTTSPPPRLPSTYTAHLSRLEKLIENMSRRSLSSFQPRGEKDDWMSNFNHDVQAYATLVELPPDAHEDDWGEHHQQEGHHPSPHYLPQPHPDFPHGWPARPPPEQPRPSSPQTSLQYHLHDVDPSSSDPSYLHPSDALHLQAILDSLLSTRAGLDNREGEAQMRIDAARDELRWMKEEVEARCAAEGRVGEAERALLDKLDWLLHLNDVRAKKHHRAASFDGSGSISQGGAGGPSVQEEGIVREIQKQIAAMLDEGREAERRAGEVEMEMVGGRGEMVSRDLSPPSLPAQTPQTYHQHASDAVFSPVTFAPVGQTDWHRGFSPTALSETKNGIDTAERLATPGGLTSRFSPNTSEQITPPRPVRPTQDHGSIGQPLPASFAPQQAEQESSYRQQLRDLPSSLRQHPDYQDPYEHRFAPEQTPHEYEEGGMSWEEEERRRRKWEKERYLQDLLLAVEDGFRRQQEYIAVAGEHDAQISKRLKELLESLRSASLARSDQDALFISSYTASPPSSRLSTYPRPSMRKKPSTIKQAKRAEGAGSSGKIPQSKLTLLPGNGRLGPRVVPANHAPRGAAVPVTQKGVIILGGPDPIPHSHHFPRWADGAAGAKAAKELNALIAHEQQRSASTPPLQGKGKGKGKGKEKEKVPPVVREMEENEAVRRALEVWRAEELVKGEEEKRRGEGVADPAAKAFAIYEILHATREIARRQKEEADRLKKGAKKRGGPPPPTPPAKQPQDDFASLVSRLLSSSEPPEKILTSLATLLETKKLPKEKATKGWKNEEETKRALRELLRDRQVQKEFEQLKKTEERELDDLRTQQARLRAEVGERMKAKAASGL